MRKPIAVSPIEIGRTRSRNKFKGPTIIAPYELVSIWTDASFRSSDSMPDFTLACRAFSNLFSDTLHRFKMHVRFAS